jgi:hypothetical protein
MNENNKQNYTQDEIDNAFIAGQKSIIAHDVPSSQTIQMFKELNSKIDKIYFCLFGIAEDKQAGLLFMVNEIREQTKKTNGRVNKIENWKSGIIAVVALLSFVVPTCIGWFFNKIISISDDIIAVKTQIK